MKHLDSRMIEIKASEGGQDARIFVAELATIYNKLALNKLWKSSASINPDTHSGNSSIVLTLSGKDVHLIEQEAGIHRLQRISKTEKRGRVHTSSVLVTVFNPNDTSLQSNEFSSVKDDDFSIEWFNGTVGAGGQHRNKTATSCRLTHLPTGIIRAAQTRSRANSLKLAKEAILKDIKTAQQSEIRQIKHDAKNAQIGVDRKRMWAFQRDVVEDFVTGKSIKCKDAFKGLLDQLWS